MYQTTIICLITSTLHALSALKLRLNITFFSFLSVFMAAGRKLWSRCAGVMPLGHSVGALSCDLVPFVRWSLVRLRWLNWQL